MKPTFTNKAEYLAYRSAWKAAYKQLSQDIRDLKFCRGFPQANRFNDPKNVERYREIEKRLFPRACWPSMENEWKIANLKAAATQMLEERKESKIEAQRQYLVGQSQQLVMA